MVRKIQESNHSLFRYDTPVILATAKFAWLRDEFNHRTIVTVNSINIEPLDRHENSMEILKGPSLRKAKKKDDDDPNALLRLRTSEALNEKLKSNEAFIPIQTIIFVMTLDGSDLVGRAQTDQGKTLAFMMP